MTATMRLSAAAALSFLAVIVASPQAVLAFAPGGRAQLYPHRSLRSAAPLSSNTHRPSRPRFVPSWRSYYSSLHATDSDSDNDTDDESEGEPVNPYADPNYPDLEFVNYDDPSYEVDQGITDTEIFEEEDKTLAEIEAMREERRRRNDEFQFETYHAKVLRGGEISLGEWTVFQTDTFMGSEVVSGRNPEALGVPRLLKWDKVLKVVTRGSKVVIDSEAEWRVDGERLVHEERLATADDFPAFMMTGEDEEGENENDNDDDSSLLTWEEEEISHVENTFWPKELASQDFRGPGGNMCVGKAYTICDAVSQSSSSSKEDEHEGPFSEMRSEVGVQENGMRFRVKLDYATLEEEESASSDAAGTVPPLHLRTLTVCRETLDGYWPDRSDNEKADDDASTVQRRNQDEITASLFGPPGATGGLYDPPPVGSEERAVDNYMLLDFEGGATVLLPHRLDQYIGGIENQAAFGWVTSLDWTPGRIRYQVDRKVMAGTKLKGLKTLELTEVEGDDADRWRPKDGGENMRQ